MPIQLGGPSLKPKKTKVLDPFGVPHVTAAGQPAFNLPPLGMAATTIPKANTIVAPQTFASPPGTTGAAGTGAGGQDIEALKAAIRADPMYSIGESNWKNSLATGERQYLQDPFRQSYMTYGFDIPKWNASHPGAVPSDILAAAQKYLDPAATEAMNKDPYTVQHQLEHNFGKALAGIGGNQAARGMLGSGGADVAQSTANYQLGLQEKNAMDQFLGSLGTANQNWLNYQNQQNEIWRGAQESIATRIGQQPGVSPEDPATVDYSGGPAAAFQPAQDLGALMAKDQANGQWDSWTGAMSKNINAANAINNPATKKVLSKVKKTIQPSAMSKALSGITGW